MSDVAIRVESLSKCYRVGTRESMPDTFAGALISWVHSPLTNFQRLRRLTSFDHNQTDEDVLWALQDVSFEVKRGDVVGIIGRNGAGKSTLLKILSRITIPTKGRVDVFGQISSLLEVGTGFHPELTGRENIYMNGTLLGMTKTEIDRNFDAIVEFSGVARFIDTPVKRFSSGMQVRLAFSVAAHLQPEILIIDEVLAVGDLEFQRKCLGKMEDAAQHGRTVLFVSHNTGAVRRLCNRAIVLSEGRLVFDGNTENALEYYVQTVSQRQLRHIRIEPGAAKQVSIDEVIVRSQGKREDDPIDISDAVEIEVRYRWKETVPGAGITVRIARDGVTLLNSWQTDTIRNEQTTQQPGDYTARITVPPHLFNAGRYSISVGVAVPNAGWLLSHPDVLCFEYENLYTDTSRAGHARGGLLSIPLRWDIRRTG